MDRRTLMHLLGVTVAGGVAGCASGDGGGSTPTDTAADTPTETPADTPTETAAETQTETEMTTETDTTPDHESLGEGLVTETADGSVAETVDRIRTDIENSPLTLMTTVDHAENAASVDRDLPATTLLVFGNPDVGTPLMQASRSVAIDLPQKMLVWDDDGQTKVTYNDPAFLARRHGIEGQDERLETIAGVLDGLATGEM